MGKVSSIEWTEATWNPVGGCSVVSPGCHNCYARSIAARFSKPGQAYHGLAVMTEHGPQWTGVMRLVVKHLGDPLRWREPKRIFVNSTSDLFHEDLTNEQIAAVFGVMAACPQHMFQLLTKRAKRMREWFQWADEEGSRVSRQNSASDRALPWWRVMGCAGAAQRAGANLVDRPLHGATWPLPNVWLGVSVEDQKRADGRIPELLQTPAAIRFVSAEPLLGPVDFDRIAPDREGLSIRALVKDDFTMPTKPWAMCQIYEHPRIDWVIVGSESGPGARPMDVTWAASVVRQCREAGVAVFTKQIATSVGRAAGDRKGGDPMHWPAGEWPREFPEVAK